MRLLRAPTLAAVLTSLCGGLLAQPHAAAVSNAAEGVTLSELSTFDNREAVSYGLMPVGDNLHLATYQYKGNGAGGFSALKSLTLHRYDAALALDGELDVTWTGEPREHLSIRSVGERFVWTYATLDKPADEATISIDLLDAGGKKTATTDVMTLTEKDFRRGRYQSESAYTPSRSHFVRVYGDESRNRVFSKRDDEPAAATVVVIDDAGEVVTNQRIDLRGNKDQVTIESVGVDADGSAYLLVKVLGNAKGRERKRAGSDAKLYLFTVAPGASEAERTDIRLQGQYIDGASLITNDVGAPTVVGLYTERRSGDLAGYFSGEALPTGTTLRPQPFTQALLEGMGKKITSGREGDRSIENTFVFRDALRLSDGRLALLIESYRLVVTTYTTSSGAMRTRTVYIYEEGVILDFDAEGNLTGALMVPKRQSEPTPSSYSRMNLVEYDGRAAVLYNDNPKNFTRDITKRTKALRWNKSLAVLGYRGDDGDLTRVPLFARRDADKVIAMPPTVTRLADGRVVFIATGWKWLGKNQLRFGVITP